MRLNLTQKFWLPTIIGLAVVAVGLGFTVSNVLRQAMINRAKTFVADIVTIQAKEYFKDPSYFVLDKQHDYSQTYNLLFKNIKTNEVVRIKIWSKDAAVVYSDDKQIIGQKFPDNLQLLNALSGNVDAEISTPTPGENSSELSFKKIMELYIPIKLGNSAQPDGVVEIYYVLDNLNKSISDTTTLVFSLIFGTFLILALLFFSLIKWIILTPLNSISQGIKEIEKGNFENKIPVMSKDEIGILANTINEMAQGLKRLGELKNEFVFVAAHELRTPVTAIKGYISMIRDYPGLTLPDEVKDDLNIIAQATQGLNQLVGDILEIARSDAGRLEVKTSKCDEWEIMKTVINELVPLIKEKSLTLTNSDEPITPNVAADPMKLKEVLTNLVSNAIKYNSDNGHITITHSVEDELVTYNVENSGMGIPAEEQKHIFEKFYRADSAKKSEIVGTGLGLFITKELVERMKGRISFTSEPGKNTIFSVSLPKYTPV